MRIPEIQISVVAHIIFAVEKQIREAGRAEPPEAYGVHETGIAKTQP